VFALAFLHQLYCDQETTCVGDHSLTAVSKYGRVRALSTEQGGDNLNCEESGTREGDPIAVSGLGGFNSTGIDARLPKNLDLLTRPQSSKWNGVLDQEREVIAVNSLRTMGATLVPELCIGSDRGGQCELKGCAARGSTSGPQAAAMRLND